MPVMRIGLFLDPLASFRISPELVFVCNVFGIELELCVIVHS